MIYSYEFVGGKAILRDKYNFNPNTDKGSTMSIPISTGIKFATVPENDEECVVTVAAWDFIGEHRNKYSWGDLPVEEATPYLPDESWVAYKTEPYTIADWAWDPPGVDIYCRKKTTK